MSRGFKRSYGAREGSRWASYGKQPVADLQPDDIENIVTSVSGVKLNDKAAEELRSFSEDGLNPDFLEDAGVSTVLEHLKDLEDRLADHYSYSQSKSKEGFTVSTQGTTPGNAFEIENANKLKPALKAVKLAIRRIESGS